MSDKMEDWERWTLAFGGMTFWNDQDPGRGLEQIAFDTALVPPWIIRPEAFEELVEVHRNIRDTLRETDLSGMTGDEFVKYACLRNTCLATCKLIIFTINVVVCYGYYRTKGVPYPGVRLSHLYDPELTPELKDLLAAVDAAVSSPAFGGVERAFTLNQFHRAFVAFAEVTNGILLDKAVTALRNREEAFLRRATDCREDLLAPLLAAFADLSRLIAEREPEWEKRRMKICRGDVEAPITWLIEAKRQVSATAAGILHPPGKRGRALKISVKEAAAAFRVSAGTIKNWDKGRGRPSCYPGRDVEKTLFASCAREYLSRGVIL